MHNFKFFGTVGRLWQHDKFGNFGIVVLVKLVNLYKGNSSHAQYNIAVRLRHKLT